MKEAPESNLDWLKAREFLTVAQWCYDNKYYNSCANRSYYAMFRAAFAALRKLVNPNLLPENYSHKGLIATFTRELSNRRKVFPKRFGDYLRDGLNLRAVGDYETDEVSQRAARQSLDHAREFLDKVKEVLEA